MKSHFIKAAAVLAGAVSLASTASAGCGAGMYCNSGTSYSSYSSNSSYMMSSAQADASYGTGSVSDTYTLGGQDYAGFSGGMSGVSGLGYNESLQSTNCPTNVYGTEAGSRVLGCYNVVQQVPQTNYVRVVRPIIYVRYPVPVAVPYTSPCGVQTTYSRYGGYGPQGGWGGNNYSHGHHGHSHGGCR